MPLHLYDRQLHDAARCAAQHDWNGVWNITNAIVASDRTIARAWHLRGLAAYKRGSFAAAMHDLSEALQREPANAVILDHLGAAAGAIGAWAKARECFEQAIQLNPMSADAHYNRGKVARQEDDDRLAASLFEQAVKMRPTFWEAYVNLGNTLREMGQMDRAAACYREAIALKPDHARTWNQLARLYLRERRWYFARDAALQAVAIDATYAEALLNLGDAYRELALFSEASECYATAIGRVADVDYKEQASTSLEPNVDRSEQLELADQLRRCGRVSDAVAHYHAALQSDGQRATTWNSLGSCLLSARKLDDAESAFRKALALKSDFAAAENNLAAVWIAQGKIDDACAAFGHIAARLPNYADARSNYGGALQDLGQFEQAGTELDSAVELAPCGPDAHWNRSLLWLRQRQWESGWSEYEWRWQRIEFCQQQFRSVPGSAIDRPENASHPVAQRMSSAGVWRGEPCEGKRLLVFAEQGLGDTLQFVRFVRSLTDRGAHVILESPRALAPLLKRNTLADQVVEQGRPLPPHDLQIAVMSLPRALGLTCDDELGVGSGYLYAEPTLVDAWRDRLAGGGRGLKVGIHWQGNPAYNMDRFRSIPLAEFGTLSEVQGIRILSLQFGFGREQLAAVRDQLTVETLGNDIDSAAGPFMDTAAILTNLDLVVTSDSAIAHLAGALGVATWLVLPSVADWRWGISGEETPWYPAMRVFRQQQRGDWSGVFRRVADALRDFVAARGLEWPPP